jgi:voltage-gated potassium channel
VYLRSKPSAPPVIAIARRIAIAVAVVLLNWSLVLLERSGYQDASDGSVSVGDALYYTTVTLTTTGYGDITPVSSSARLVNALLVTPLRLLFVLVLVGTTIQVLTERSREQFQVSRWRARVKDHVVVCGYGTKGRSAVRALLQRDYPVDQIVVVDEKAEAVDQAARDGITAVHGSTASAAVLRETEVHKARAVIVAVDRDDTAVLTTLSVRQLNREVTVVAAVREEENVQLVRQSGADSVITSSDAAGRLLGLATESPQTVSVIEDLLAFGHGLDLLDRQIRPDEVGLAIRDINVPIVAVVRGARVLHYDDADATRLESGDRVIYVGGANNDAQR